MWEGVSDAAKDLVLKLLIVAPEHRIPVGAALRSNWMQGISEADSPSLLHPSSTLVADESSSGATAPADDIDDFSSDDECTSGHRAAPPAGGPDKRQRLTGTGVFETFRPKPVERPTPLQGRGVNAQSRQAPVPPPASKPPSVSKPPQFRDNKMGPPPKPTRPSAKSVANKPTTRPLGMLDIRGSFNPPRAQ